MVHMASRPLLVSTLRTRPAFSTSNRLQTALRAPSLQAPSLSRPAEFLSLVLVLAADLISSGGIQFSTVESEFFSGGMSVVNTGTFSTGQIILGGDGVTQIA
jgi:hypothetical protein